MTSNGDDFDRRDRLDRQENRASLAHAQRTRRMDDLRSQGLWEACFSKNNELHLAEFSRAVAELIVLRLDYRSEEVEGVRFLFVAEHVATRLSGNPHNIPFRQTVLNK